MALSLALGRRANLKYFSVIPSTQLTWKRIGLLGRGFLSSTSRLEVPCKEEFEMGDSYCVSFETSPPGQGSGDGIVLTMQKDQLFSKVFSTVSASPVLPESLPSLTIDYQGKQFYSNDHAGTGVSFKRRESARIIRKPIQSLFPAHFSHDIKVMARVLCCDGEQDTDVMVANATSAALMLSDIPWGGPIGVVRIARIQGQFVINPSRDELRFCDLDLVYACTRDHETLMEDIQARELVTNKDRAEALQLAHRQAVKYLAPQVIMAEKAGKSKNDYTLTMLKPPEAFFPASENDKVKCTLAQRRPGEEEAENLGGTYRFPIKSIELLTEPDGAWQRDFKRETEARISMIKDDGEITLAAKNKTSHMLARQKVETVIGNEVEVGGLHEDQLTEIRSCVEVNDGYVCASEKPNKQVNQLSGKPYAVQRQEYYVSGFSGAGDFSDRRSKHSMRMRLLDLYEYYDFESEIHEWVDSYESSGACESEISQSEAKL